MLHPTPNNFQPTRDELLQMLRDAVNQLGNVLMAIALHPEFEAIMNTPPSEEGATKITSMKYKYADYTADRTPPAVKLCQKCGIYTANTIGLCNQCQEDEDRPTTPEAEPTPADAPPTVKDEKFCINCGTTVALEGWTLCFGCAEDIASESYEIGEPIMFSQEAKQIVALFDNDDEDDEDSGEWWLCPICKGSNPSDESACGHCGVSV